MMSTQYQTNTLSWIYSASSLKHQSMHAHVAPFGHILPIPSKPVFALTPQSCMLSGEAANTNFIVSFFIQPGMNSQSTALQTSMLSITLSMLLVFLKNHTLTTTHFMTLNSILLLVLLICCKKTNKTAIPECVPYEHINYKPYKLLHLRQPRVTICSTHLHPWHRQTDFRGHTMTVYM